MILCFFALIVAHPDAPDCTPTMLALAMRQNHRDALMRQLHLQHPLLVMLHGVARPVQHPGEGGLHPGHPHWFELGAAETLMFYGVIRYLVVEGLVYVSGISYLIIVIVFL